MVLLGKYITGNPMDLRNVDESNEEYVTQLRDAGFLDCVLTERPNCEPGFIAVDTFNVIDGKLVQHWEIKEEPALQQEVMH